MRRRITLSRATLHDALDSVVSERGSRDVLLDLRADAYGHGADEIVGMAGEHGIERFIRSDADARTGLPDDVIAEAVYGTAPGTVPVMTVTGEVVACKRVPAGSAVSYGYTYRVASDSNLALVGLGYADGVPRAGSNKAHVLLRGGRRVLAGRVAMDQFMVDLGDDLARPGDDVVLWGAPDGAPTPLEWADASGFGPLELTTRLGVRFERVWTAS
ncbi:hypothetical protein GCM10027568_08860 [Humibacter soli]